MHLADVSGTSHELVACLIGPFLIGQIHQAISQKLFLSLQTRKLIFAVCCSALPCLSQIENRMVVRRVSRVHLLQQGVLLWSKTHKSLDCLLHGAPQSERHPLIWRKVFQRREHRSVTVFLVLAWSTMTLVKCTHISFFHLWVTFFFLLLCSSIILKWKGIFRFPCQFIQRARSM